MKKYLIIFTVLGMGVWWISKKQNTYLKNTRPTDIIYYSQPEIKRVQPFPDTKKQVRKKKFIVSNNNYTSNIIFPENNFHKVNTGIINSEKKTTNFYDVNTSNQSLKTKNNTENYNSFFVANNLGINHSDNLFANSDISSEDIIFTEKNNNSHRFRAITDGDDELPPPEGAPIGDDLITFLLTMVTIYSLIIYQEKRLKR